MKRALKNVVLTNRVAEEAGLVRLVATIKASSPYYSQADFAPGSLTVQLAFPVDTQDDMFGWAFVGGPGGRYRREDLHLFAVVGTSTLVALS